MKWKRVDAPGQASFPSFVPDEPASVEAGQQWMKDEIERLLTELLEQHKARGGRPHGASEFTCEDIRNASRIAQAFLWLLPRDSSKAEAGRSDCLFGLLLKRYRDRLIALPSGQVVQLNYGGNHRCKRYRLGVGTGANCSDLAEMMRLVPDLVHAAAARHQTAGSRVGGPPKRYEFQFSEVVAVCEATGRFSFWELATPSGQSSLGLVLSSFRGMVFQATGVGKIPGAVRFSTIGKPGRGHRYSIERV